MSNHTPHSTNSGHMANDYPHIPGHTLGTIGDVVASHIAESKDEAVKEFGRKAHLIEDTDAADMASGAAHYAKKFAMPLAIAAGVVLVAGLTTYFIKRR